MNNFLIEILFDSRGSVSKEFGSSKPFFDIHITLKKNSIYLVRYKVCTSIVIKFSLQKLGEK